MCFVAIFHVGNNLALDRDSDCMSPAHASTTNIRNLPYSRQRSMNVHENKMYNSKSGGSASRPHFAMGVGHPSPQHSASEGLQRNIVNTMAAPDAEVSCEEDDGQIRMTDSALTGQSSCEVGTPSNNASGDSPPSISIVNGNNSRVIMNIDSGNVRSTNTHDSYNDNSTKVQDRTRSSSPTDAEVEDPHRLSSRRRIARLKIFFSNPSEDPQSPG